MSATRYRVAMIHFHLHPSCRAQDRPGQREERTCCQMPGHARASSPKARPALRDEAYLIVIDVDAFKLKIVGSFVPGNVIISQQFCEDLPRGLTGRSDRDLSIATRKSARATIAKYEFERVPCSSDTVWKCVRACDIKISLGTSIAILTSHLRTSQNFCPL